MEVIILEIKVIKQQATKYYANFLEKLEKLVSIDSGSGNYRGINRVADFLRPLLEKENCEIMRKENKEFGPVLIGNKKGNGQKNIMLLAHMDTVWEEGTVQQRPFCLEGNKAFGPGVTDCCSGMLTQYFVLRILGDLDINGFKNIFLVFNPDEELGSPFSRDIITDFARKSDISLVMEAPDDPEEFITSRAGKTSFTIKTTGKAAHSGTAYEKGISAIDELLYKLRKIQKTDLKDIKTNIATIQGGEKTGIIPPRAEAEVEFRVKQQRDNKFLSEIIEKLCSRSDVPGASINFNKVINFPPFAEHRGSQEVIDLFKECGVSLNMDLENKFCGGCSDGCFTAGECITIDGLAPYGERYHTPEEYLQLDTILPRINLITLFIIKYLEQC